MTIFDVLAYPVSLPPTIEELQAIPKTIISHWAYKARFTRNPDHPLTDSFYNHIVRYYGDNRSRAIRDVTRLISMLRKYDNH